MRQMRAGVTTPAQTLIGSLAHIGRRSRIAQPIKPARDTDMNLVSTRLTNRLAGVQSLCS